jgi:hypothetical protein
MFKKVLSKGPLPYASRSDDERYVVTKSTPESANIPESRYSAKQVIQQGLSPIGSFKAEKVVETRNWDLKGC